MIELDWQPNNRKLRQFAACALVALPVVGWWWQASSVVMSAIVALSVLVGLVAWCLPRVLQPLYLAVSLMTLPIGWIVGELLLGLIYFGVFWPIGLIFQMSGRDALGWRVERQRETYWEESASECDAKRYYQRY